jgi:hypothetical protein
LAQPKPKQRNTDGRRGQIRGGLDPTEPFCGFGVNHHVGHPHLSRVRIQEAAGRLDTASPRLYFGAASVCLFYWRGLGILSSKAEVGKKSASLIASSYSPRLPTQLCTAPSVASYREEKKRKGTKLFLCGLGFEPTHFSKSVSTLPIGLPRR